MRPSPFAVATLVAMGCRGVDRPHPGTAAAFAIEVGKPGQTIRGVAGDGARTFVARGDVAHSDLEARTGAAISWHVALPGSAGVLAISAGSLIATLATTGKVDGLGAAMELHGEPSSAIVAFDAATGAVRWRVPCDGTEFAVITAIAPVEGGGVIAGGTFSGTLRIGDAGNPGGTPRNVVSSAGKSDGFVTLAADGKVRWVVRVGGANADTIQGVAARGDRIAIAGTFMTGAELLGEPLPPFDEKIPRPDGFVAELDATGARRWLATFGGKQADSVAGVAIDSKQRVAVAATIRDTIKLDGRDLTTRGDADGLVAWFSPGGEAGAAIVIGGTGFDGLRGITAVDDRVVVGGFFHGSLALGKRAIDSNNGDDGFFAVVNAAGQIESSWHLSGSGREELTSLSSVPGGFIAGVAHSAELTIDDDKLPAPADPASGAALVGRPAP